MSENSIGLKTRVLEGLLEETLGQRYYAISSGVTLCYAGSGQDNNQRDFKQIGFLDITAFYSTQKHFRVFILGTPEGWQVSIYDLQKHEWVEKNGRIEATLRTAKATAQERTSLLLGKKALELKWH